MSTSQTATRKLAGTVDLPLARERSRRSIVFKSMPLTVKASIVVLVVIFAAAALAPVVATHDPTRQDLLARMADPSSSHWLGTDSLGRDVFSRTIYGARMSIAIALFGTVFGAIFGSLLGLLSGFIGGRIDNTVMFLVDAQQAMPFIIVCLVVIAVFGAGIPILLVLVSLAGWETYTRFARASSLVARESLYVLASRSIGNSSARTLLRHVLPNIASPLIVLATLNVSSLVLLESALSYLGVGVRPPTPSWGQMISDGRQFMNVAWWITAAPATGMILLTLSFTFVGDWLRDVLDPTSKRR